MQKLFQQVPLTAEFLQALLSATAKITDCLPASALGTAMYSGGQLLFLSLRSFLQSRFGSYGSANSGI